MNRGTIDNIHTLRQIIEKAYKIQMDILFIDFKQAFDTIYRNKMIKILQGIPSKLVRWISVTLQDTGTKVVVRNNIPES